MGSAVCLYSAGRCGFERAVPMYLSCRRAVMTYLHHLARRNCTHAQARRPRGRRGQCARILVGFSGGEIYSGEVRICEQGQPDLCRRAAVVLRGTIGPPGITRFGPGVPTQVSFPSPPGAFGPRTPTEAFGPCYSQYAPICGPLRGPYCSGTIPWSYYAQIGSICAECQCIVPAEIQRRRGARRG
jgi:hypothetical protein